MKKSILILFIFLVASCSSNDNDEFINDQSLYDNNKYQDFELFEKAKENISNKQFDLALTQLDKLQVIFPSSGYSSKSMLLTAYVYFLKKDYEKTRALAENFKKYYPGNEDIVYANYLDAMTYYVLIKKTDYSQKNANEALKKFSFILNAYPNSKYEIDIITKVELINNNLALGKIETAKFYLNKKNTTGALLYFTDIFENHSSSPSIEETLYFLTKIYNSLEEKDLAKKYASILAYNFPESVWYEKSYNIINDLENIEEKESWFESLNPIKLFKTQEKNVSNNTGIKNL